jgi:cell wall assembly regulator SMI1
MKTIWDRIHVWLASHAPEVLASLRPGASEEELRSAEAEMGGVFDTPATPEPQVPEGLCGRG